jgi:hypothetical protein
MFFFARNSRIESSVLSWRNIVIQHPIVCNVRADSLDTFSKSLQDIFVDGVINCLSCRYKFFVPNATVVKQKQP